jgi:hypothetical protein
VKFTWLVIAVFYSISGHASEFSSSLNSELPGLICDISNALAKKYPNKDDFQSDLKNVVDKAKLLTKQVPEDNNDDLTWQQAIYDKVSQSFEYYLYPSLIADTSADNNTSDFMMRMILFQETTPLTKEEVQKLAASPEQYISTIENNPVSDDFRRQLSVGATAVMMMHTGLKTEQFAKLVLHSPRESLSYRALFQDALSIANGDVLSAVGIIGTVLGLDAASPINRNRTSVVNSKIIPALILSREEKIKSKNFNYQPGFNYHFWCHLGEAWIRSPSFIWARSFVYEDLIQKDPQEGSADKLAIETARKIQSLFMSDEARKKACGE